MKDVAKKFIETYINIYQINIRDVNDQERLLKDLSELELDDCLLFMKKHEIQEKRFVYFHKAIMEEYQRCLKRLKRELLDNKRKEINELIDHAKWERNYGKLDYWYQKIMKTKKEEKKVLTKKQLEDIRKLETKKRVMDYTLPQKVEMVEKHKDVSQMGLNDKIFKAKPKFSKRNSWVRRNLIKCATVLTTMLAIPSLLGYAKKNNDYEKKTHINQMNFLDNNLIN
ncbi:MAG: hypothetical protein HFI09_04125, partial [Bacilli bacterium]|nr:hypothetical protein [Bacilli bacterium]